MVKKALNVIEFRRLATTLASETNFERDIVRFQPQAFMYAQSVPVFGLSTQMSSVRTVWG